MISLEQLHIDSDGILLCFKRSCWFMGVYRSGLIESENKINTFARQLEFLTG